MNIQGAYFSRVLNGQVNLNLEQAFRLSHFLGMASGEKQFFFNLIEKERAGTIELRQYFQEQVEQQVEERNHIHNRLSQVSQMSTDSKAEYYSNWYYQAIHLLVSLSSIESAEDISKKLNLNIVTVNQVINFLKLHALIGGLSDSASSSEVSVHLPGDSPLVVQHHRNWRLKAMQDARQTDESHLHFSSAVTVDNVTYSALRKQILSMIENAVVQFQQAPTEDLYCLNIDWYRL